MEVQAILEPTINRPRTFVLVLRTTEDVSYRFGEMLETTDVTLRSHVLTAHGIDPESIQGMIEELRNWVITRTVMVE